MFISAFFINTMNMQRLTSIRLAFIAALLSMLPAFARAEADIKVDITKESSSSTWYMNPVVWIIGAAVFVLLLVALLRGGGRRA